MATATASALKLIVNRDQLARALGAVSRVVPTRTTKPILSCVRIGVEDKTLFVSGTSLELFMRLEIDQVEIQEAGAIAVPAAKLAQVLSAMPDETVKITEGVGAVGVAGGNSKFSIPSFPVEEFPPLQAIEGEPAFAEDAAALMRGVRQAMSSCEDIPNARYAMAGMLFESRRGNKLSLAATDGSTMAVVDMKTKAREGLKAIVPRASVIALVRAMDGREGEVKMWANDHACRFEANGLVLWSNVVDGSFPPYRDVIPTTHEARATIDTAIFTAAANAAKVMTSEESKGVAFGFSSDGLVVESSAPEVGVAAINARLTAYEGPPVRIGFNPQLLLRGVAGSGADSLTFDLIAPNKPGKLTSDQDHGDFVYIAMPINIQ